MLLETQGENKQKQEVKQRDQRTPRINN